MSTLLKPKLLVFATILASMPVISQNYFQCGDMLYQLLSGKMHGDDAMDYAHNQGGYLPQELAHMACISEKTGAAFWIGITDANSRGASEGNWKYFGGPRHLQPLSESNWCQGQPNNRFFEDWAVANWKNTPNHCWNDQEREIERTVVAFPQGCPDGTNSTELVLCEPLPTSIQGGSYSSPSVTQRDTSSSVTQGGSSSSVTQSHDTEFDPLPSAAEPRNAYLALSFAATSWWILQ